MIKIIDYGVGNVLAFVNMYVRLNIPIAIAKSIDDFEGASKIILPGVGSFDHAMNQLNQSGMRGKIENLVLDEGIPILGVCVGMQMLAKSSDEGVLPGLGWIDGQVKKIDPSKFNVLVNLPHMGWNDVEPLRNDSLFKELEKDSVFYFLHSYYFSCNDDNNILARTEYGRYFTCAVSHKNIYGVQFHPEKSHQFGSQLLKNFAEL